MRHAIQFARSLAFNLQMYLAMPVIAVAFLPAALVSRRWAVFACKTYCRWVIWTASWMVGLKTEIRGTPPDGPALVAAKHQSFFDIIVIFGHLPAARFIMKQILLFAPILGQYAWRIGCVPVNRSRRSVAMAKMVRDAARATTHPGQLVIYPQGTRVPPGERRPYKIGAGVLYATLEQDCYPVATNIGVFWPKRGVLRRPGTAVVEFLPPIPAGRSRSDFLAELERLVESRSDALAIEAGGPAATGDTPQ